MRHILQNTIPRFPRREDFGGVISYNSARRKWLLKHAPVFMVPADEANKVLKIGPYRQEIEETLTPLLGKYSVVHAWISGDIYEFAAERDTSGFVKTFNAMDGTRLCAQLMVAKGDNVIQSSPSLTYNDLFQTDTEEE